MRSDRRSGHPGVPRRAVLAGSLATVLGPALPPRSGAAAEVLKLTPLPKGQTRNVKIGIGGIADPTHIAVWYAKYGGLFDDLKPLGITVDAVPFGGGSEWLLALTSGQVQMAHGYFENAIRAQAQGRDVVQFYNVLPTPAMQVVVRKGLADKITTVKETAGLRWGITSFGSATHAISLRVVAQAGLKPTDIHWTPVGGTSGYLPSIRDSRVDIETAGLSSSTLLDQEGSSKLLVDLVDPKVVGAIWPGGYLGPGMLSSGAYANQEPFVTFKVLEAVRNSIAKIRSSPAEDIAKVLPAEFQQPTLAPAIAEIAKAFAPDGITEVKVVASMIGDMSDLKLGKGALDPNVVVDNRFAEALRVRSGQ